MKKIFRISLVVSLVVLLLSACQGVENGGAPTAGVSETDRQAVSDGYDFVFEGEEVDLSDGRILPVVTPSPVGMVEATNTAVPEIPAPAGCNASFDTSYEDTVLRLINEERADRDLQKLTQNSLLYTAARTHSLDMACSNYFSHNSLTGLTPFDRIKSSGYTYRIAAENLYAGSGAYNSPEQAVKAWMNSPAHRKNILTTDLQHIAISYVFNPSSTYGGYVTVTFGTPLK